MSDRTPWQQARRVARGAAHRLAPVEVSLAQAAGCVLATPLRALVSIPACDTAAMDGYAVAGRGPWTVDGSVLAGQEATADPLSPGRAVEVATGAPVPAGVAAVLPYEQASRSGRAVDGTPTLGRHVRRRGEDCVRGTELLAAGAVVTPALLGLAASLGHDTLTVRPRPGVAILVTGDEVVTRGVPPPGRVRDALGPLLPGLVHWAGGQGSPARYVPDGSHELADALASTGDADVLVACGASSAGPADHLPRVLRDLGAELLVDGVACRPGHPQLLARLPDGRFVVGLPGNPHAALVAALTLLVPLIGTLTARSPAPAENAVPAGEIATHTRDTRLVAVRRTPEGVVPAGHDRPGTLWGAALADALAVVPPGWCGEDVELLSLPA